MSGVRSNQDSVEYYLNNDPTWIVASSSIYSTYLLNINSSQSYDIKAAAGSTVMVRVQSTNYAGNSEYAVVGPILIAGNVIDLSVPKFHKFMNIF